MAPVRSTKKLLEYYVVLVPAKEKEWEIECDTASILSQTWLNVSSKR